jgi:hypothetical protein
MSTIETAGPDALETAGAAPRKVWRAPKVIQAEQCPQAAKTLVDVVENHSTTSTSHIS